MSVWMFQDPVLVSYIPVTFFFLDKIQVNPNATEYAQLQTLERCIALHPSKLHSFGYSVTSDNHYVSLHPQMTKKQRVLLAVQTVCGESTVAA